MINREHDNDEHTMHHILNFDSYGAEIIAITPLSFTSIEQEYILNSENLYYQLQYIFGYDFADIFGLEQHGAKVSLTFMGVPQFGYLLAVFALLHANQRALTFEGIYQVIFNAQQADEIVYHNVSSLLLPYETKIPSILMEVQAYHINKRIEYDLQGL